MNTCSFLRIAGAHLVRFAALALALAVLPGTFAQGITTGGLDGSVTDASGKTMAGATIAALHEPSGTIATTTTRANGQYNLSNLRIGGPYTVTATAAGLPIQTAKDVYIDLNETASKNFSFKSDIIQLEKFTVGAERDTTFGSGKMGTSTSLSDKDIENIASVRRNVQDIAATDSRLALMSLDQGGQLSAQGQNFRFNSFTVDGVQATDPFGLNSNGFSSLRSPIPLDAIQSFSVDLAPYDVRRAGATGAYLNAVIKSGTNQYHGSLYYERTDQDWRDK
ncbi:MAG: carboxypeptidase-like regulatory domain-containing protein, partial [Opitutaceae bacterium]